MKRILMVFACAVFALLLATQAFAAPVATIDGAEKVAVGSNVTLTVSLSGCDVGSSYAVSVTHSDKLELVSGTMGRTDGISKFDMNTKKGTFGYTAGTTDINGTLVTLVFKGLTAGSAAQSISINVIARNGSNEICNQTINHNITVNCASHDYGTTFSKVDAAQHSQTCSVCGDVKKTAHTWDGGTPTKNADCKEEGNTHYTCTAQGCGAEKDEVIKKTDTHNFGAWSEVSGATCTEPGEEKRVCSVCSKPETREIKALGHSYGAWAMEEAATCTESGKDTRVCKTCGHKDTRKVSALGHDFENPKIVKEPTISEEGLKEGTCKRCGEVTSEIIPCTAEDEASSVVIETQEGTFAQGTEMSVESVDAGSETFADLQESLSDISDTFSAMSILFNKNGSAVKPNGVVTYTVPAPEFTVKGAYLVGENGDLIEVEFTVGEDGTVSFASNQAGVFVLVAEKGGEPVVEPDDPAPVEPDEGDEPDVSQKVNGDEKENEDTDDGDDDENASSTLLIGVIIIALLMVASAGVCFWFIFKKK